MISAPEVDKKREGARAVFEALAQIHPASAALARIYELTHPSTSKMDHDKWIQEVTAALNELLANAQNGITGGIRIDGFNIWGKGISSVVDEGIGKYTFNFCTPLESAEYHVSVSTEAGSAHIARQTASGFTLLVRGPTGPLDANLSFAVIR